jgi:hypothetical protein
LIVGIREVQLEKQNPDRKKYIDKDTLCLVRVSKEAKMGNNEKIELVKSGAKIKKSRL